MMPGGYVPDAGDLIWTDFDPTRGHEQAGRRPARDYQEFRARPGGLTG
jgi:mRNA-degrading endonuclease toxin of MazEF toxin-antitoxin module